MRPAAACLVAGLGLAITVGAQTRPDFSGAWTLDLAASQLAAEYAVLESGVVRIVHDGSRFRYERTFVVKATPYTASFAVTTDGQASTSTGPGGESTTATMRWLGDTLLLEQQMVDRRGAASSNVVCYQLSDGGATLLASEDFKSGDRDHHNLWVFRRRQ